MLVDTNVLIDVLERDARWFDWSFQQLHAQSQVHELVINPVIYAELALAFKTSAALDATLTTLRLPLRELPREALFLAGQAFAHYRRRGGARKSVLADFFIGAHAAVTGMPVLTRDVRRYQTYFPSVRLVSPAA